MRIKRYFHMLKNRVRGLSLDLIKRRLDRGVYKRLDRFQEDVFTCLERARRLSRTDSQPFEDSVELQAFFLRTRDDVTRSGELLQSPALNYTLLELSTQVAELKRIKQQQELNLPNEDESCDGNETKVSSILFNTKCTVFSSLTTASCYETFYLNLKLKFIGFRNKYEYRYEQY